MSEKKLHTLDDVGFFIKFQDRKEYLEDLQRGNIFAHNIKFYNRLEQEGIGDFCDSKVNLVNVEIEVREKGSKKILLKQLLERATIDNGYSNVPIFCLYSLDIRNIKQCGENEFTISFNDDDIHKIKKEFGNYALLITDRFEFMRRVKEKVGKENLCIGFNFVEYTDFNCNEYRYLCSIKENRMSSIFWKDANKFKYQQEYRIAFLGSEVEDTFEINIGSIKDISCILKTEELLNYEFSFKTY